MGRDGRDRVRGRGHAHDHGHGRDLLRDLLERYSCWTPIPL